jgi:hypothetical protein
VNVLKLGRERQIRRTCGSHERSFGRWISALESEACANRNRGRIALPVRTKSGRVRDGGAPQQCVADGREMPEGLKTYDFSIRFSHGMKTAKMLRPA